MQCYEYEVLCRWMGARLRSHGAEVRDHDITVSDALIEANVHSVAEILRLRDPDVEALARSLCNVPAVAA